MKKKIFSLFSSFSPKSMSGSFIRYFLAASLIPIAGITIFFMVSNFYTTQVIQRYFSDSASELTRVAEENLNRLGEEYILTKARDVARQADIYFSSNRGKDFKEMRKDPEFMSFALQKVGQTGYTAMYEAGTWIFRVHPNEKLLDRDVSFLARDLPAWWELVFATRGGKEVAGYYDWLEPDGTIRKKFMAITPARTKVKGRIIMVAATTYIDEFSSPAKKMRERSQVLIENVRSYQKEVFIIFTALTLFLFLLISTSCIYWGKRIARGYIKPIINLADTARRLGEGNWDAPMETEALERSDEVGIMARSFQRMASSLQEAFAELSENLGRLRKTQEALRESEAHYRGLFEGIPIGLFRSSPEGKLLDVNPALIELAGYPDRETLLQTPAQDLYVNPKDREELLASLMKDGVAHGRLFRFRRYDGREIWAEISVHAEYDEQGGTRYFEGSVMDVTQRVEAEQALKKSEDLYRDLYEKSKKSEELYRSLMNSSADAIVTMDLEGKVTYISPVFTDMFGWRQEEVLNRPLPIPPEEDKECYEISLLEVIHTGEPVRGLEAKGKAKDGRVLELSISASRYADHEGKPAGVLMIIRDISETKKLKNHFEQMERLEALATLAGGIAHDFNNLLMVMEGRVSLLMHQTDPSDPRYNYYVEIESQIQRGSRLIKQLLGYARRGKYEVKLININDLLREVAEPMQRTRKDIRFRYYLKGELPWIEADPNQLNQVFMNLFLNAADAMPEGGTITLETDLVREGSFHPHATNVKPGKYIRIIVSDTGHGMDAKTMDRIFEPFFTTKPPGKGTGLGLSSVYGIVKAHGGYIYVTSEPGFGTTFYLYFPAIERQVESISAPQSQLKMGKGTVLVVDDEKPVLEVCAAMLETLGYKTFKAASGEEAIRVFQQEAGQIDGVILDMIMPDMGGAVVFEQLRAIRPNVRILLSSGFAPDRKAQQLMKTGLCIFIQKPFRLSELSEKMSILLSDEEKSEAICS
ncbi:MAG: PAS domain S-box protein [Syntrophales bacterium]|nr:PAS domain S-box protein [Syntrophales bacterium]